NQQSVNVTREIFVLENETFLKVTFLRERTGGTQSPFGKTTFSTTLPGDIGGISPALSSSGVPSSLKRFSSIEEDPAHSAATRVAGSRGQSPVIGQSASGPEAARRNSVLDPQASPRRRTGFTATR